MTSVDRRIWTVVGVIVLAILLWLVLDHVLFPTLPVPAGAPPITR